MGLGLVAEMRHASAAHRHPARPTARPGTTRAREHDAHAEARPLWWYARVIRSLRSEGGRLYQHGCGDGELLKLLTPYFETFGYDEAALVRHRCRTQVPDAVILEAPAELPSESADIVVWMGSISRQDALPHLRELRQLLGRDGHLVLVTPNPGGLGRRLKGRRWLGQPATVAASFPTLGEWRMVLRRAGLEVTEVQGDGLWDAPYFGWIPSDLQRSVFGAPLALSSWLPLSRWLLPATLGESLVLVARRKS